MIITLFLAQKLAPFLIPNRTGKELVALFNKYGARDLSGLLDIGKTNGQRPSKTQYTEKRLIDFSGKGELRDLLSEILATFSDDMDELNVYLLPEGYRLTEMGGELTLHGGVVDKRPPVVNQAHFTQIQKEILAELDKAQVSIKVIVAWFTNDKLFEKLLQTLEDGINRKHGVDITRLPHKLIKRAKRGCIMHDKFCIIDNQVVITGSYNWTDNAEFRNDENITIENDPSQATRYSLEYRRLTN